MDSVDLFAEVEPAEWGVFVRDRGGWASIRRWSPDDRQGLAKSIRARVERRGGRVVVKSELGKGTEIRIHMPRGGSAPTVDTPPLEWQEAEPPQPEEHTQ